MNAADTALAIAHTSSGAEALAKKLPRSAIVSAFGTVPSEVFFGVFAARRRKNRPSMLYCGDNAPAKMVVAGLIRDVGFAPLDLGALRLARYTEPFSLLMGEVAYEGGRDPAIAYRFERFGE
jgi:predicted dinucleotide-binding enzyme